MRLTYDPDADALALTVSTAAIVETEGLATNVMVDLGKA
jgi:uncharacterized protein YuzE